MAEVLVLGATSMVGSHFVCHAGLSCSAAGRTDPRTVGIPVERFDPVELANPLALHRAVFEAPEPVVVNFAAITDVDGVESQRPPDLNAAAGDAWAVNALAPAYVAHATNESKKFLVQLSTDFVFDGERGPYDESAPRSPFSPRVSWYGWTKSEGERRTSVMDPSAAILRIAYPYRSDFPAKLDFARRILQRYRQGSLPSLYTDQQISPTWVPDVTNALQLLIRGRTSGVVHVASPTLTTPFEFATELLRRAEGRAVDIARGSLEAAPRDPRRAPRPLHGGLRPDRAKSLEIPLTPWPAGIEQLLASQESRP
ncbi:MAG TPA: sugar nucleotide-binding protein [Thermoplasmata archaeon]|nr:sugar nucleotide-binding protein [Thermoplasmata archaeon]